MTVTLSPTAQAALKACLVTRGANAGLLTARAPSPYSRPKAYAAWQGAMMSLNPFKVSIGGVLFIRDREERAIFNEVKDFFDAHPELRGADRDRAALERLGVW